MRNFLILLMFITFNNLYSQEIVEMKEVYIDNDLVYKDTDDELLTGIAQNKRKNGHLIYEEEYKNGIILFSNIYYNGKEKRVSTKTIYNPNKPQVLSKEYKYNLESVIFEITTYDNDGIKNLVEQFKSGKLTYSCQYLGKKKHGFESSYDENGVEINCQTEYINGKKIK